MNTSAADTDPVIRRLDFQSSHMTVYLSDGRILVIPLAWYPRLEYARMSELLNYEIFAEGEAVVWPDLDEHIGLDGLLEGRRSAESAESFSRWRTERTRRPRYIGQAKAAMRAVMKAVSGRFPVRVTVKSNE